MFARTPFRQATIAPLNFVGTFQAVSYTPASKTVISTEFADLSRIYEDGVNLCLVQRPLPQAIENFVNNALKAFGNLELSQAINPLHFNFTELWPQASRCAGYGEWLADIELLTSAFCELFELKQAGLRLRTLKTAMCPRFHVDRVPARMICSYGGIGTEWLPEYALNRRKLGMGSCGQDDAQSGLIVDQTAIRRMPAYAVGLMKGEAWEGNEGHGFVHRSPIPTAVQPRRLVLTLDML
ncbi:DUF1826 domain-containing protein [Methylomonas albis]|uniref:DUF1826 domain-containing protein n=1 Tax=Methylomonas albis TaxID=1854563 RepID=A0ABR9D4N0_9GAMM|nr:DUF1826 domain-containing protein [Methylomonas albis]MBD9357203.1 DUF1826 domain-containing protein [Methylomonas albis]